MTNFISHMSRRDTKRQARLRRQFKAIERHAPVGRRLIRALQKGRYRLIRIPLSILLIIGGLFGFLPVLGLWMLPAGLLLLAIDVPSLQPFVSAAIIRTRRWIDVKRQRWRSRRGR